jgi:hypothetical protein
MLKLIQGCIALGQAIEMGFALVTSFAGSSPVDIIISAIVGLSK